MNSEIAFLSGINFDIRGLFLVLFIFSFTTTTAAGFPRSHFSPSTLKPGEATRRGRRRFRSSKIISDGKKDQGDEEIIEVHFVGNVGQDEQEEYPSADDDKKGAHSNFDWIVVIHACILPQGEGTKIMICIPHLRHEKYGARLL